MLDLFCEPLCQNGHKNKYFKKTQNKEQCTIYSVNPCVKTLSMNKVTENKEQCRIYSVNICEINSKSDRKQRTM